MTRQRCLIAWGTLPFVLVLVLISGYFGLADPYEPIGGNLLPGSDFESSSWRGGMPAGWRGLGELSRWGESFGYEGSGGLELRAGAERGGRVEWTLEDPTRFTHVRVRGRLRIEEVERGKRAWNLARLVFFCRDEEGRSRWDVRHTVAYLAGTRDWRIYEATLAIPEDVRTGHLVMQQAGKRGRLFVDELELLPMRLKASFIPVRRALMALWGGTFLLALATLAPWRRRGGLVVTGLSLIIVVGVAAPADALQHFVAWQRALLVAAVERVEALRAPAPPEPPGVAGSAKTIDGKAPASAQAEAPAQDPANAPVAASRAGGAIDATELPASVRDLKKWGHAMLFALLGLAATLTYSGSRPLASHARLTLVLLVFAASTELLQFMVARRQPTLLDLGVDTLGLALGMAAAGTIFFLMRNKETRAGPTSSP